MEEAIKELQDAMVVMAHLEKRQPEILKQHARMIETHDAYLQELHEFRRRTDQNLAEITDKLNGLIGYVENLSKNRPDA
jgi:hypothetical protein